MKKVLAVVLSALMALMCCIPAFAAEKTISTPASAYAEYDRAKVAQNDADYIAAMNYDQIAGVLLDWLDRRIATEAADFNAFIDSLQVADLAQYKIEGVDSLIGLKDHVADLEGDFANLNTDALVTREGGDVNFFYGVFQFMADNAETFGKVFRWDDEVFDYGKVGEFIESDACTNQAVKDFYHDYLLTGNIQEKFVAEIAREMGYEIPKNGEERAETFDETISNGIKAWFLSVVGEALSEESKAAVNAMDLRTTDVYTLVKEFVGLLQNDYKGQLDNMLSSFLSALQGMVKVITAGVNVEPPVLTVGYTGNDPYATYHPYSTEPEDYMPNIYANDQAIAMLREYGDENVDVLANSEMTDADKALVAGTPEAWGKNVVVKATANNETLVDLDVDLSAVETAAIAALEAAVNEKGMSQTVTLPMLGETTVAFTISDAAATFSYNMYKDEDSFAAQVKVESATAKVNITSPIEATVTANLLDPDATVVELGGIYSALNSFAQPMVIEVIKNAVGTMFEDPAFATVVLNNLDGEIAELEQIKALVSYIDADAAYDENLLNVMADYDAYKGVVGQVNHILYKAVDMIASDEGMAYLGIEDGDNTHLYANLQKICEKVSSLLDTMKNYIDRDTFVALADTADISAAFASEHGFNAGMIYDMDFSSVENALDCGIRVACDLLAEDDPNSIFYDFHMRVEDLDTLDAIAVAATDMVFDKVLNAVELEGWNYTYTAMDAAAVDAGTLTAKDAIWGKLTDVIYEAAVFAADKVNALANDCIAEFTEKTGITLSAFSFDLGVEKNANWETTLTALVDRFIALTDGLMIPAGAAKEQTNLWDKLTTLASVIPMNSMFSNYNGLAALNADFFDKALDGDIGDFLSHFEVKEDAIAGDVPVTYALIKASDYIVDKFFPDTVQAELYTANETVQETFTGAESDQGIAARNMVSINGRKSHIVPAVLDLIREVGMLPGFACDHANVIDVEAVAATCKEAGTTAGKKCADCGTILEGCEPTALADHTWSAWTQTKAPTCTAKGTETRTCSVCGKTETRDVNAKGHNMVAKTTVAPTCVAEGYTLYECANGCGATEKRDVKAATGNHNYVDGKCTVCGASQPSSGDNSGSNGGNFFSNIWNRITSFFQRIINFFKNLF